MISFGANPASSASGCARNSPWISNNAARKRRRNSIERAGSGRGGEPAPDKLNNARLHRNHCWQTARLAEGGEAFKNMAFAGCGSRIPCYIACSRLPALVRRSEHQETPMSDFKYSLTNLKPVESQKITLTFPDGARREFPSAITGLEIAKGISPSLAKRTVAMALDGALADLTEAITQDAKIEFIAREEPQALQLIRHDCAHVLAEAVQSLWPGTQVTIGPV